MKPTFLLFLSLCCLQAISQTDSSNTNLSKGRLGLNVGAVAAETTDFFDYNLYLTYQKGKNLFGAGPVFMIFPDANGLNKFRTNMLGLVYQRTPYIDSRRFELFFFTQALLQQHKEVHYLFGHSEPTHFVNRSIELTMGYGVKLKITNHLNLNSNVGIGHYVERRMDYLDQVDIYEDFPFRSMQV